MFVFNLSSAGSSYSHLVVLQQSVIILLLQWLCTFSGYAQSLICTSYPVSCNSVWHFNWDSKLDSWNVANFSKQATVFLDHKEAEIQDNVLNVTLAYNHK
jgi:hypothetical protein